MIAEILKDYSLSTSFVSDWISLSGFGLRESNRKYLKNIQVIWQDAAGDFMGSLEIFLSAKPGAGALAKRIRINNESNKEDSHIIALQADFEYIKVKYTANGMTQGRVNLILF